MPFTHFHFGPALIVGLPLRKYIHAPTFIVANVIVDVEPFLVLFLGLRYPLHGYFHTFLSAFLVGFTVGYVMFLLERVLNPLYKAFLLEADNVLSLKSFVVGGVFGICLHVLLDSTLYTDIRPFYPIAVNPLLNPALTQGVYTLCVWMGIIGIIYFAGLLTLSTYDRVQTKREHP